MKIVSPFKFKRHHVEQSAEEFFIERYDQMLIWALQLTGQDSELAEDLLHDLFIEFTLNFVDPGSIDNPDGYLYVMLRNLHLAHQRRATRNRLVQLGIVEYDSAVIGLETIDFRDQLSAQEDLLRICVYACARKETAKIASVLILRFFHGYYPDEIMQVAKCARAAVDNWLKVARGEAKARLEENGKLAFINKMESVPKDVPEISASEYRNDPEGFLKKLREMIFRSRQGSCFSPKETKVLYQRDRQTPLECRQLAHLVSCSTCLDRVNGLLGLALLKDRSAAETLNRNPRNKGGGQGHGGGSNGGDGRNRGGSDHGSGSGSEGTMDERLLRKLRRKVKDTLAHKPNELCIAVNGYELGSQLVTAERSELNLVVDRSEDINFVEIYSEQKIRFMLFNIDRLPPAGPGELSKLIKLSNERLLKLTLRFTNPSPTIQVVYLDPTFKLADEFVSDEMSADDLNQEFGGLGTGNGTVPSIHKSDRFKTRRKRAGKTVNNSSLLMLDSESSDEAGEANTTSFFGAFLNFFIKLWEKITNLGFWLKPETITVMAVCLILTVGVIWFISNSSSNEIAVLNAPEVLKRAAATEQTLNLKPDIVLHRTITLEERKPDSGEVRSRQRIETWQNAGKNVSSRRLYDDRGQLIAGEFTAHNVGTVYRKRSALGNTKSGNQETSGGSPGVIDKNQLLAMNRPDLIWQLSPSAKDFSALIADKENIQLEDQGHHYLLRFEENDRTVPGLIKASLLLSKSDLHPIEQTLLVRRNPGTKGGPSTESDEMVEYRFVETAFEQRTPNTVAPSVFEPDPELLVPAATIVSKKIENQVEENINPILPANANTNPVTKPSAAIATADLEVEVLRLLNQAGADIDDQTNVIRTSDGKIRITGVVDSKEQKNEILRALAPVADNPALVINVETYSEAAARQKQAGSKTAPISVERIEVNQGRIAVYDDVRRYLGKSEGDADDEVRRFSAQILNRSRSVMSIAGTLKKLAGRFSKEDLKNMSPEARAQWLAVLHGHARNCQAENRKLRTDLQAVFGGGNSGSERVTDINSDAELQQVAAQLFNEAAANDRIIRSAFTISGDGTNISPIKNQSFLQALIRIERLSESLQRVK